MVSTLSTLIPLLALLITISVAFHLLFLRESQRARSIRARLGIPAGKVIYSDLDRPARVLTSRRYGISGKPDYIVKDSSHKTMVPVEIKSGRADKPYLNHTLQLAAYCLLVEESYNRPVPYGVMVYADGKQHKVYFDKSLRSLLLKTVGEMRKSLQYELPGPQASVRVDCRKTGRCRSCSFLEDCERLGLSRSNTKNISRLPDE